MKLIQRVLLKAEKRFAAKHKVMTIALAIGMPAILVGGTVFLTAHQATHNTELAQRQTLHQSATNHQLKMLLSSQILKLGKGKGSGGGGTPTPAPIPSPTPTPPPPTGTTTCSLPQYPTSSCTGVPAGTVLTDLPVDSESVYTVTQDNAVIDSKHIPGTLIIKAVNVTISNSQIDNMVYNDFDGTNYSFSLTDSTVGPATGCIGAPGVWSQNFTADRVYVRGHDNGFQLAQPGAYAVVRDSFTHVCGLPPSSTPGTPGYPDGSHSDPFQAYCPSGPCGSVTLDHNTFDDTNPYHTAPVFAGLGGGNGYPVGFTLTNNLLVGGVNSIYVGWQAGPDYTISNNRVVNNSWDYAPVETGGTCEHQVWSGNSIVTIDSAYNLTSTVGLIGCM